MATALDPVLTKKTFNNWLKGALAVLFTREGLTEFVKNEISDFQADLLQSIFTKNRSTMSCSSCTTANMLNCPTKEFCDKRGKCKLHDQKVPNKNPNQKCPNNICHNVKDAILKYHRFQGPTWQITDATRWCSDAFQIAKCYLPPKGYDNKGSFAEIDFNGTLSVIINNTRFQNQMTAQINTSCSKVRDMINENIRHSASYELSDIQLATCIDALRDLLKDSKFLLHDQHAQDAVNKLNQLQSNTLVITAGDITKVLDEDISKRISEQQQEAILSILDHLAKVQEVSVASLGEIIEARDTAIKAIQQEAEQQINYIKQSINKTDDVLFKEFKEELVRFYTVEESMISASPLVEDHAVPLMKLYVQPPMSAFIKPNAFGQGHKPSEKMPVSSYRNLFLNNDMVPYKNIYLEANAGYGKTSFSQKVAMTWCLAQNPPNLTINKAQQEDVDTLKRFDLLFLLHLRDFQGDDTCLLDDLILKFVSKKLPSKERFSKQFIGRMLHNKTCLVILDGLDEWVHPETCPQTPGIPHNNYRERCTQLTTTRPWKLSTIGLTPNLIDRHIEISALDETTSSELKTKVVKLLCENSGEKEPDLNDFNSKAFSLKLGDICLIPYILLQLICIWFDGLSIGKSKCETYSNTIELTLKRGLNKKNVPTIPVAVSGGYVCWVWQFMLRMFQLLFPTGNAKGNVTVPECMRHNVLCNQYMNLLLKVGKAAFYALFQKIRESSLVMESTTVLKFVTEQELEFCLKIGLLSQSNNRSKVSEKRHQVFFQHKSIQEFLAALYITSEWNDGTIKSTILEVCSSLSSVLEMENLFVFVCGMNPVVYSCISGGLQKIVDLDSVTCRYRTNMYSVYDDAIGIMLSYQSMQVQCLQESVRNGNDSCLIHLHDIMLVDDDDDYYDDDDDRDDDDDHDGDDDHDDHDDDDDCDDDYYHDDGSLTEDYLTLETIINFNKCNVKSLKLSDPDKIIPFLESLDPGVFTSLEILRVEDCDEEPVWLADILTKSLKFLTLSNSHLSDISMLTGLTCLQYLYLVDLFLTHSNLNCLYAYISRTTTLTQLRLENIDCSDHEGQYRDCDVTMDLHRLNELKMLDLVWVPCKELHVNPACLEELEFCPLGENMTARASATLWQDLRAAPVLSSLTLYKMASCQEMIQTIRTLSQLQYLHLWGIDMDDVIPRVSPAMTELKRVELSSVRMSSMAWRELLLSVGHLQHPVTVEIDECRSSSREEWQTFMDEIKSTPTLSWILDLYLSFDDHDGINDDVNISDDNDDDNDDDDAAAYNEVDDDADDDNAAPDDEDNKDIDATAATAATAAAAVEANIS